VRRAIYSEIQKARRTKTWLAVSVLLAVQIAWAAWGTGNMNADDLRQGWLLCLYQFPLLNSIMMPVIIAVIASRLGEVEHKGHALKQLETMMPAWRLFDAKFLCGSAYVLVAIILQCLVVVVIGCTRGFEGPPPLALLGSYLGSTLAVSLTLLLLEQTLSLLFNNQAISLAVGLIGGFAGFFALYLPESIHKFIPWSYYGLLMQVRMNWNRATHVTRFYTLPLDWSSLTVVLVVFGAAYIAGHVVFGRKEV